MPTITTNDLTDAQRVALADFIHGDGIAALKRWHGDAVLVTFESGSTSMIVEADGKRRLAYGNATRTVPVASNGLEGWTSCCGAAVTFSGHGVLCCKACWHEVETVGLGVDEGVILGGIVASVIDGRISADEGVAEQRRLLNGEMI